MSDRDKTPARAWRASVIPCVAEGRGDMANNPRKMKDPTEAALSAIQEALNLRDIDREPPARQSAAPSRPAAPPADEPPAMRRSAPRTAPSSDDDLLFEDHAVRPAPVAEEPK